MDAFPEQFQHATCAFLEWFTATDGTRLNPKLELADLRASAAGRGAVAKAAIAEDEELFAITHSLVLDTTNSDLQQQIDIPLSQFGPWDSLLLVIIYEYLRNDTSPWYPYLKILPTDFDTLMYWNAEELAELQGSAVLDKIGKSEAEEDWKRSIIPFMNARPALFPIAKAGGETTFIKLAHMAGSLIMSYAFDLGRNGESEEETDEDGFVEDDEEDPRKGMVPFADMLNADADRNNARLFHEEGGLVMKATRSIAAGDEIFNDYGPLPRSDLLRMYGYLTDNYAQYDVVELSSQATYDVAEEIRKKTKGPRTTLPRFEDFNDIEDGYAINRPSTGMGLQDVVPMDLQLLLSALVADTEPAKSTQKVPGLGKRSFSLASADLLAATIQNRLTDYETTIREDSDIVRRLSNAPGSQVSAGMNANRYRMAVQVRKGEKEILQHVLELAQQFIISRPTSKRKRDTEDSGTKNLDKTKAKR